jgi:hypothetical protein
LPRLSLWNPKKGNDYSFIDKTIAEMYVIGGTSVNLHRYLGPMPQGESTDATLPEYETQSENNIQDLLFLENRDRKYDPDVFLMRGIYQRSDNDFDLTQFGLFLQTGTVMMTFHYNEMLATIGRKIMAGDVLELMHLKDDDVNDVPAALKRYYVVGDCAWAAEGFSPTWYPHLWRCKLNPLVDSQEYKDIMKTIKVKNNLGPMGTSLPPEGSPLVDIMSNFNKVLDINNAIIEQATAEVPKSGYDVSHIYSPQSEYNGDLARAALTADNQIISSDDSLSADNATYSPTTSQNPSGYLTGDGLAPNGLPVGAGVAFPTNAQLGDYFLRLDYLPNRLFRYSSNRWIKVEDNVRTNLTAGDPNNQTLRNSFANNDDTNTLSHGHTVDGRQGLSKALRPESDY